MIRETRDVRLPVREIDAGGRRFDPESASPGEIVAWALERFRGHRLAASTSFGMEGCMLVDLLHRAGAVMRVVTVDTGFLFDETIALRARMAEQYPCLRFDIVHPALTPEEQARVHGPRLWETDPGRCCRIRKLDPMTGAMAHVDVWFTGLRRGQTEHRRNLQVVEWDWQYELLKINPLAPWSRTDVWNYVQEHGVPFNPLHEHGYPTVGCTHCTAPVPGSTPDTYSREGRWPGRDKSECGLHFGEGI